MKRKRKEPLKVLVVDVGGTHVKCASTDQRTSVEFESGPRMTPARMTRKVLKIAARWRFDAVSIGYPGVVRRGAIVREPHNLGAGWV